MRKALVVMVAILLASLSLAGTAQAQDAVIGTVTSDPAAVPEAGEYTMTATGSAFIPDTAILLVSCVSPADTLVPGTSDLAEITAAALAISALADCDFAKAQNVEVDGDGAWSAELTATVGDNFFLSAGALDGSQAGATWIPIVPSGAGSELAKTGIETGLLAVVGTAILGAGVLLTREGRRFRQ
jgi:LPXTG-motif cell wall-anchored protein